MKRLIFAVILFVTPFLGWTQQSTEKLPFIFGPQAGVNVSRLVTKVSSASLNNFESRDRVGFHAGFFARFPLNRWYFQPEITCFMKGGRGRYNIVDNPLLSGVTFKQKMNVMSVDMPLLIGYHLGKSFLNFRIFTGPVIGYTMSKKLITEPSGFASPEEYNMNVKDATWSWTAGLGLDVWKFTLDARYERGLHDVSWNPYYTQVPSGFMFTIGYKTL